jgi:hypothetical protein
MEKLTKEELKFIDNYLLKADVIYKDIRVEMVDHVATAVEARMEKDEEDFYSAFKDYMVEHKKTLNAQNKLSSKLAFKRFWKTYLVKLLTLKSVILIILMAILVWFLSKFDKSFSSVETVREISNTFIFIVLIYYIIRIKVFMKNKFSSLFFSIMTLWLAQVIINISIRFFVVSEITGMITAVIIGFLLLHFILVISFFTSYYKNKYEFV